MATRERKPIATSTLMWLFVLPIILVISFRVLDASPCLFFYDLVLPANSRFSHSYRGKTIWITGSSSGIGAELVCQLFAAEAGRIILSARRVDRLEQIARDCSERVNGDGGSSSTTVLSIVPYDAMDEDSTEAVVQNALKGGSIDVVILNAGIYQVKRAIDTTQEESRRIMRVNYEAAVEIFTTLVRLDEWKKRRHGQVLVVSSLAGHMNLALSSTYAASKHALGAYFHTMQAEESSWLRVSIACPGPVVSEVWNASQVKATHASELAKMPVHRAVRLMLTGTIGPSFLFYETWIGNADIQSIFLLKTHFPTMSHATNQIVTRIRIATWEKYGLDEFSLSGYSSGLVQILRGQL